MLFDANNIKDSIYDSLKKAVKSANAESVYEYAKFFHNLVTSSMQQGNFKHFQEFIGFPSAIYSAVSGEDKKTGLTDGAMNHVVDMLGLHLREIIFLLNPRINFFKAEVAGQFRSRFYYEAFASFSDFLYKLSRRYDWEALKKAINYFNGLSSGDNDTVSQRLELNRLESQNINGLHTERIVLLKEKLVQFDEFVRLRRHVNLGIKYWLYFLYEQYKIDEDKLLQLIGELEQFGKYRAAEDIVFFRTGDLRTYMGWDNWDFVHREESKLYSPPMPADWMTKGFVIDSIRSRFLFFKIPLEKIGERYQLQLLIDAVNGEGEYLELDIGRWGRVLEETEPEGLRRKVAELRQSIAASNRVVNQIFNHEIVDAPLSETAQNEFQLAVKQSWLRQSDIRKLFDRFSNKTDLTGDPRLLKRVGPNSFFERAKIQFIDGPHYKKIHGIEDLGAMVGRWENELFLEVAFSKESIVIQEASYLKAFESCFARLKKAARVPTIILVHPNDFLADSELASSNRFSKSQGKLEDSQDWPHIYFGSFDDVKIFGIQAERLRNRILVTNFAADFEMLYKTAVDWIDGLLAVKIELVSDELAQHKLSQNPEKWTATDDGARLSPADALELVKTSIVIDIETIVDFEVKDDSYTIAIINNSPEV